MIKQLRVTVDGISYDVSVEVSDGTTFVAAPAPVAPASAPAHAPVAAPAPAPAAPAAPAPAAAASAPEKASGPGAVPSPLTGRVTAVAAKVGQQVNAGDNLITLEAMKMNTFVNAPKAGKVTEVKVAVGDAVEENQLLARIE